MKKVYIAHPITPRKMKEHDAIRFPFQYALRVGEAFIRLLKAGYCPICPTASLFFHCFCKEKMPYKKITQADFEVLKMCDYMLVIADKRDLRYSKGVKKEIEFAKRNGIKVFYNIEKLCMI